MLESLKAKGFQIQTYHHAEAILLHDMPGAIEELEGTLFELAIPMEALIRGGGGQHEITQWMAKRLSAKHGWIKHNFRIMRTIDDEVKESITHEVDHVKLFKGGRIALEIEWNTKDPSFDRDLENFRRLHVENVISVGSIITRGTSLQASLRQKVIDFAYSRGITSVERILEYYTPTPRQIASIQKKVARTGSFECAWADVFFSDKFSTSTTHWGKLEPRVERGLGSPCPLLLIGIPESVVKS